MSWKDASRRKEYDHDRYMRNQAKRKVKDKAYREANRELLRYKGG